MNTPLSYQIRERLLTLSFHAYEGGLLDLLTRMGYREVSVKSRTKTRQFTSHGGHDMEAVAKIGLTSTRLLLQAKQYRRPVSRRFVDELRGTMLREGASQGLLISTSLFSEVAKRAALSTASSIHLLDGEALANAMIRHGVGVRIREGLKRKRLSLDHAYFETLTTRFP